MSKLYTLREYSVLRDAITEDDDDDERTGSDLILQDTAGYPRLSQETAGYLYIKTYHFILINFIAGKYFKDIKRLL